MDQSKQCSKCGEQKLLAAFGKKKGGKLGLREHCRECQAAYDRARSDPERARAAVAAYRLANPTKAREYYQRNRKRLLAAKAAWAEENRDRRNAQAVARRKKNNAAILEKEALYRERNRERVREITRRHDRKARATPRGKLENAVSAGISASLAAGAKAGRKWQGLVGYTLNDLITHLEQHFLPGMTLENYGKWHLDHVVPISAFNYESPDHIDFRRAWALSNLQPLWAADNIRKRDRLAAPFQPSLAL